MLNIKSKLDFEECLNSDKAVLFLNFEWSGYTAMARPLIYNWLDNSTILSSNNILKFEFSDTTETHDFYNTWLTEYSQKKENAPRQLKFHGYGDIIWLQEGQIKGGLSLYTELSRRTKNRTSEEKNRYDQLTDEEKKKDGLEYAMTLLNKITRELIL